METKFVLSKNHSGLKNFFVQCTLSVGQTRWLKFLSEYEFEIKHIKGNKNQVVGALSRIPHEVHVATINMCRNDLRDQIIEETNLNQQYSKAKETLQQENLQQKFDFYKLKEDGALMYKDKVYVPNSYELKGSAKGNS